MKPNVKGLRKWCGNWSKFWGVCRLGRTPCNAKLCPILAYVKLCNDGKDGDNDK